MVKKYIHIFVNSFFLLDQAFFYAFEFLDFGPREHLSDYLLGQAIGPLWDFCAPISIIVEL